MDKEIAPATIYKKRRNRILVVLAVLGLIIAAVLLLRTSFAATLKKSAITTAVAEMGSIENTITATGEILPEFKEIITSPISASIQEVVVEAAAAVKAGQPVMSLDKYAAQTDYEKMAFGLESKNNEVRKTTTGTG